MENTITQIKNNLGKSLSWVISVSEAMVLASDDFSLTGDRAFHIKNNSDEGVSLGVKYAGNATDVDFVDTLILPGWNLDLVVAVEKNSTAGLDLQYGY